MKDSSDKMINIFCDNCSPKDQAESTWKLSTIEIPNFHKRKLLVTCSKCGYEIAELLSGWIVLST